MRLRCSPRLAGRMLLHFEPFIPFHLDAIISVHFTAKARVFRFCL